MSACAVVLQTPSWGQETSIPTESKLRPAVVRDWADRVISENRKTRSETESLLVRGGADSFPLLQRFLHLRDDDVHDETFEIIRRIGPEAVPLLTELLRHEQAAVRRQAVSILIDLAPDTEPARPALIRALHDEDLMVARDAVRALGALGERAGPAVAKLVKALSHDDEHVRIYAAEALASIGAGAAGATEDLAKALRDPVPGVRWAACEAFAAMGPAATAAVRPLIDALQDEFLYVRICAAGALGSIGPQAEAAVEALRAAARDRALRCEAEWALERITGLAPGGPPAFSASVEGQAPAGEASAGTLPAAGSPPISWNPKTGRNIVWDVALGHDTFGRPVVAGETVYVGTDNGRRRNPAVEADCGVLMAFRVKDGTFLWQDVAPRAERGLREFLLPSTTSAPHVEGDRLYYVTAECQLRCLDTQGFLDGENDGPYQEEAFKDDRSADIVWELDMCARLGVFPHEASNSEVAAAGDLLFVSTSNGRNEGHTRVPSPRAPSLIAVNKRTGEVVWRANGPGENILHGQWCSPAVVDINGRPQVLFGGGDGWLRAYDATSGREFWRFDGNPKDAQWLPRPGVFSRSPIVAPPLYRDGRVFVAMGQDPSHGNGPSLLHAVNPDGHGDVTGERRLWTCRGVGRVVGTPVEKDGLLYVGDVGGTVHCLDTARGEAVWKHETHAAIWGCVMLTTDRLYAGNIDGVMTILRAGRQKEELAQIEMEEPLYARPVLVGDAFFLATAARLFRIEEKK